MEKEKSIKPSTELANSNEFGKTLEKIREELGDTQQKFCDNFNKWLKEQNFSNNKRGITQGYLSNIERGEILPGEVLLQLLVKFCKALLKINTHYLTTLEKIYYEIKGYQKVFNVEDATISQDQQENAIIKSFSRLTQRRKTMLEFILKELSNSDDNFFNACYTLIATHSTPSTYSDLKSPGTGPEYKSSSGRTLTKNKRVRSDNGT